MRTIIQKLDSLWSKNSSVKVKNHSYYFNEFELQDIKINSNFYRNLDFIDPSTRNIIELESIFRFFLYTYHIENRFISKFLLDFINLSDSFHKYKSIANKFLVDESYHSVVSNEILTQLEKYLNYLYKGQRHINHEILKLNLIDNMLTNVNKDYKHISLLSFCFVSEVSIPNILSFYLNSNIPLFIQKALIDHIKDEKMHALFFNELFKEYWYKFNEEEKRLSISIINETKKIFLKKDLQWIKDILNIFPLENCNDKSTIDDFIFMESNGKVNSKNIFINVDNTLGLLLDKNEK